MSHLKEYQTNIENLEYLQGALKRIKANYYLSGQNVILTQAKDSIASFQWNGKNYILYYDMDFWTNRLTVNSFIEKITREYSAEKIVCSMNMFGFKPEFYEDSLTYNQNKTSNIKDLVLIRSIQN